MTITRETSQAQANLWEVFSLDNELQDQSSCVLKKLLREASASEYNMKGKRLNVGIKLGMYESFQGANEGEVLRNGTGTKKVFANYDVKSMYSTMSLTFLAMKAGKNKSGSAVVMEEMQQDTVKSALLSFESVLHGSGLGQLASVAAATTGQNTFQADTLRNLRVNMSLDVWDSALTTKRGSFVVGTNLSRETRTLNFGSDGTLQTVPAGMVAGDKIFFAGALENAPVDGKFMMGIDGVTDNTLAFGNISPVNFGQWRATNLNAASANISENLLHNWLFRFSKVSGIQPDKGIYSGVQKLMLQRTLQANRRFTSTDYALGGDLSFERVSMGTDYKDTQGNIQWNEDPLCPDDSFYCWNDKALFLVPYDENIEMQLASEDGLDWRNQDNTDTWRAFMRQTGNLVSNQRQGIGKLSNLAVAPELVY